MKNLTPIENYSEFGEYEGKQIEVIGEIFNDSLFENAEIVAFNRVRIIDTNTKIQIGVTCWGNAPTELSDLKEVVKNVKADPKRTINV